MAITEDFINAAECKLTVTVTGEDTRIVCDGNGPGMFLAVQSAVEALARRLNISFEALCACLMQAYEDIENSVVEVKEGKADADDQ